MIKHTVKLIALVVLFIVTAVLKYAFGWSTFEYFMVMSMAMLTMIYLRGDGDER